MARTSAAAAAPKTAAVEAPQTAPQTTEGEAKSDDAAVWAAPSSLVPWAQNPKGIESADLREMKRSIRRFGFGAPIVARSENREIIEGHLRHAAALAMRLERVPVRFLDISADEAHLLAIAAWKFEHRREADEKAIADILEDLEDRGIDIEVGTGFDDDEINELLASDDDAATTAADASGGPEQNFGPATAAEQSRLDVKMHEVVCPKCRHEFLA